MKTLNLKLNLGDIDGAVGFLDENFDGRTPVIFKVQDANGQLIQEGVASSKEPTRIELRDTNLPEHVFVRVVFPNGKSVSQPVNLAMHREVSVEFTDRDLAGDDWEKWALTRSSRALEPPGAIYKFRHMWLCLWAKLGSNWERVPELPRANIKSNDSAKQVDLELSGEAPRLLQFGGTHVPWTLVSLPPGRCRLYFTANPLQDSTNLPIKVIVSSFRPEAETLLEFLSRDALKAADAMLNFGPVAERLLHEKYADPVSAIIGAYVLLRLGQWKAIDPTWFRNLHESFSWSSDAALIRCAVTARRGLSEPRLVKQFCSQFSDGLERGFPLFEEGHRVLLEIQTIAQAILDSEGPAPDGLSELLERCKPISASRVSVGSSFAVLGARPDALSPSRQKGAPPADDRATDAETSPSALDPLVFTGSALGNLDSVDFARTGDSARRQPAWRDSVVLLKDL